MFWTPAQLRMAINSTARFIHGYNATEQGNGLIDVDKAWRLLKKRLEPVNITSRVEVHTLLSDFLADPGHGPGIYDREGVTIGQRYTRTYTFTRTSGPNRPVLYHLDWVGNDGTFSTQNNVQLAPERADDVDVNVNPRTSGIHSAILQLDNSSTDGIDYETMNTVIAPDVFTAANGYTVTKTGMAGRNHVDRYFFRVPAGDPVLKVDLAGPDGNPGTGQVRFLRFHPWGLGVDSNASTSCYAPPVAGCATGDPLSRTVDGADEGVWEVTVEARRTSDTAWAPYTLTASLYGVAVTPNPDVIADAQVGVPVPRSYSFQNNFASFTGQAVGSPLGSARRGVFTIADGDAAGLHDHDPGRLDLVPGDDRRPVGRRGGSRPLRLRVLRPDVRDAHAQGPECRRGRGGVGHDRESDGRHVAGGDRRLRDPVGVDDVQLRRHLRQPGPRLGVGDRRERAASKRLIVDGSRLRHGRRDPGGGSRPPRSGQRDDRRRREGRLERGRRSSTYRRKRNSIESKGPSSGGPFAFFLAGLTEATYYPATRGACV